MGRIPSHFLISTNFMTSGDPDHKRLAEDRTATPRWVSTELGTRLIAIAPRDAVKSARGI